MILKTVHITELSLCEAKTVTAAANPAPQLLMADNNLKERENCLDGNFAGVCLYLDHPTHTAFREK